MPRPEPPKEPGALKPELQKALKSVGPARYASTTAREFAPGGEYNKPTKRRRYALT